MQIYMYIYNKYHCEMLGKSGQIIAMQNIGHETRLFIGD